MRYGAGDSCHRGSQKVKITTISPDWIQVDAVVNALGPRGISTHPAFLVFIRRDGQWFIIKQR